MGFTPPPPKEEEVIPQIPDLVKGKDLLTIRRLMTEHLTLGDTISKAKKERDKITAQLKVLAGKYKIGKAEFEGDTLTYYSSQRSSILPALLLANGVQPEIITASTKTSTSYSLKVSAGKDEAEETPDE
jgi:hypothetical protein